MGKACSFQLWQGAYLLRSERTFRYADTKKAGYFVQPLKNQKQHIRVYILNLVKTRLILLAVASVD
jgi:hypothetical protein